MDINSDTWVEITETELSMDRIYEWCVRPDCGAVVAFSGTVRSFSEGRPGVEVLAYEAYENVAVDKMRQLTEIARSKFDGVRRVALVHRVGMMTPGESTVIVAVSSEHRGDAFDAARFLIDTLKTSVPIWKKESWRDGSDWGLGASSIVQVGDL